MRNIFNDTACEVIKGEFSNHAIISSDGHGWFTQGKRSYSKPVFYENEFNSIMEAKFMQLINRCGIEHHQLSPGSIDTELNNREKIEHAFVVNIKSRNKKPLGIDIHCDAWDDPDNPWKQNRANGFCVYYYQKGNTYSSEGKKIARMVADSIISSDIKNKHIIKPRHDNGIKGANFLMLRKTDAPWVLIENGFMTNEYDLKWLRDDQFRNNRALAILDGLYNYIKS